MTEEQWLNWNDMQKLLKFLRVACKASRTKIGRRKLRLAGCAYCRSTLWRVPVLECYRQVVEKSEQYADWCIQRQELTPVTNQCPSPHALPNRQHEDWIYYASWAMHCTAGDSPSMLPRMVHWLSVQAAVTNPNERATRKEQKVLKKRLCDILRDIIGNPFASVEVDPHWLLWKDSTVRRLAEAIYADRSFHDMPILGDALEEAGCENPHILSHCRQPAEHAFGCWVIDLLLGKGTVEISNRRQSTSTGE